MPRCLRQVYTRWEDGKPVYPSYLLETADEAAEDHPVLGQELVSLASEAERADIEERWSEALGRCFGPKDTLYRIIEPMKGTWTVV